MESFSDIALPAVIALIMFNLGLSLKLRDFQRLIREPKILIIGLVCQMILLPLIAFGLASLAGLSAEMKTGIVLIAACPGGATSNLITYHLKGDVALSISLTSLNSVLILVTIPLIVYLAMNAFMQDARVIEIPVEGIILKIFLMVLLPTGMGLALREWFPERAQRLERWLKWVTTLLLAVVFSIAIFGNHDGSERTLPLYFDVAPWVLGLNVLGMLAGYWIARFNGFGKSRQITLAVEVGIQNSALAITIASSPVFLDSFLMSLPAVVYGLFTFFNAVIFGLMIRYLFR
jgi:BASS family bile acid:Na+ symporter